MNNHTCIQTLLEKTIVKAFLNKPFFVYGQVNELWKVTIDWKTGYIDCVNAILLRINDYPETYDTDIIINVTISFPLLNNGKNVKMVFNDEYSKKMGAKYRFRNTDHYDCVEFWNEEHENLDEYQRIVPLNID